jgi:hypothetical protein
MCGTQIVSHKRDTGFEDGEEWKQKRREGQKQQKESFCPFCPSRLFYFRFQPPDLEQFIGQYLIHNTNPERRICGAGSLRGMSS